MGSEFRKTSDDTPTSKDSRRSNFHAPILGQSESSIKHLQKRQEELAEKLFPFSQKMEELPKWAVPLEAEEKRQSLQNKITLEQKEQQELAEIQLRDKHGRFQTCIQTGEEKRQELHDKFTRFPSMRSFEQARKIIEERSQKIAENFQKTQSSIGKIEKQFEGGDE